MTIKKEVLDLLEELKPLKIGSSRWKAIMTTLEKEYKMTAWTLLGLYENPPRLEYTTENMNLLLEKKIPVRLSIEDISLLLELISFIRAWDCYNDKYLYTDDPTKDKRRRDIETLLRNELKEEPEQ